MLGVYAVGQTSERDKAVIMIDQKMSVDRDICIIYSTINLTECKFSYKCAQ